MNQKFWDKWAPFYDQEFFNVLGSDKHKIVLKTLRRFASKNVKVVDFGCGPGNALTHLCHYCEWVYAIDLSPANLKIAEKRCVSKNVSFIKQDLTRKNLSWINFFSAKRIPKEKVDLGISINAIIMPSSKKRLAFLETIRASLKKGGKLILVVPSLESALLTNFVLLSCKAKEGFLNIDGVRVERWLQDRFQGVIPNGIVDLDGVPTKHFLKEELEATLNHLKYEMVSLKKVQYPWSEELTNLPKWTSKIPPWDWMACVEKK